MLHAEMTGKSMGKDGILALDNLDCLYLNPGRGEMGVFDGMSSNPDSILASQTAASIMESDGANELLRQTSREEMERGMGELILRINKGIRTIASHRNITSTIGTTAVIGKYWQEESGKHWFTVAHSGDSRAYRYREGKLDCLTIDDNVINDFLIGRRWDLNKIFRAQDLWDGCQQSARLDEFLRRAGVEDDGERKRLVEMSTLVTGMLTNADGPEPIPHVAHHEAEPGDVYLCVSDGVTNNLKSGEMTMALNQPGPFPRRISNLVAMAHGMRRHPDDVTAAALWLTEKPPTRSTLARLREMLLPW